MKITWDWGIRTSLLPTHQPRCLHGLNIDPGAHLRGTLDKGPRLKPIMIEWIPILRQSACQRSYWVQDDRRCWCIHALCNIIQFPFVNGADKAACRTVAAAKVKRIFKWTRGRGVRTSANKDLAWWIVRMVVFPLWIFFCIPSTGLFRWIGLCFDWVLSW